MKKFLTYLFFKYLDFIYEIHNSDFKLLIDSVYALVANSEL